MNSSLTINEITNKYYIYYFEKGKPKLLKKDSEPQLMCSLDKLKSNGLSSYLVVDLITFDIISYNYKETENIHENYALIVKAKEKYYFFTVSSRPFYDEAVYLSMGEYIMINRKESTYFKSKTRT